MGKEDPSSELYIAPSPSSFLTTLLLPRAQVLKSPPLQCATESPRNFSCVSPVWSTVIFLKTPDKTQNVQTTPGKLIGNGTNVWPGWAWGRSVGHSTACGFSFPDTPASEHFRWAALSLHSSQPQILSLSSPRSPAPVPLLFQRHKQGKKSMHVLIH